MKLKALNNTFVFTFVDKVNAKGEFERETTESGIVLKSNFDESAKSPRWVKVVTAGEDCKVIKPGMLVLLPNLRWTISTKFLGERVWRSDEEQAAAYQSEAGDVIPMDNFVLFEQLKPETTLPSGIIVMGGNDDTPKGKVVSIGKKVWSELQSSTMYYNDTNFTDTFTHKGKQLSFIKESDILAYA